MKRKELIFLKPQFRENIWGGDRLAFEFGYEIPGVHTGECLVAGDFAGVEIMVEHCEYEGMSLSQLWKEQRDVFGDYDSDTFPLNIKLLDASEDLSVQVHPDRNYANENENGADGRTKFWYVLDCDPDSEMVMGHHAQSRAELKKCLKDKAYEELLREVSIEAGDMFQINPGCVHGLKQGTFVYEVSQGSDVTYRIYDYDRDRGEKKAELHSAQAALVTQCPHVDFLLAPKTSEFSNATETELISNFSYRLVLVEVEGGEHPMNLNGSFAIATVIEGSGEFSGIRIRKGNHFIIPNRFQSFTLVGAMKLLLTYPV